MSKFMKSEVEGFSFSFYMVGPGMFFAAGDTKIFDDW